MRIWFDTEFIDDGRSIDLISIGMVRADGAEYYAEFAEFDSSRADDWIRQKIFPHLCGPRKARSAIAADVRAFAGDDPEFWAFYADYDWVALCQLYGRMMRDLPDGWPKFCLDIRQIVHDLGNPSLQRPEGGQHHALADARWNRRIWESLRGNA